MLDRERVAGFGMVEAISGSRGLGFWVLGFGCWAASQPTNPKPAAGSRLSLRACASHSPQTFRSYVQ